MHKGDSSETSWDFKNATAVLMSPDDLYRLYEASERMYQMHTKRLHDTSLIDQGGIYTCDKAVIPLIYGKTGTKFGEIVVGLTVDPESDNGEKTFAIMYSYESNGSNVQDSFVFKRYTKDEGDIIYQTSSGEAIETLHNDHWQFRGFINTIESFLRNGALSYANQTAYNWDGGKNNGGKGNSKSKGYDGDDIPF
jgi:hypothetical protein